MTEHIAILKSDFLGVCGPRERGGAACLPALLAAFTYSAFCLACDVDREHAGTRFASNHL